VRLFVAADPSAGVRRAAALLALDLKRALERHDVFRGIRWVPEENLHLTVWFLGEVEESLSAQVLDALRSPLRTRAFRLEISGFGAFPPSGSPRVLWLGVTAGLRELAAAHAEVGSRLQPLGFAPEGRAYSAHLTVARTKSPLGPRERRLLRDTLHGAPAQPGACRVESLTVYRSRTAPKGAVYEPLLRVPLT